MEGKELIKKRFAHNLDGYDALSVVQRAVCKHVDELLGSILPSVEGHVALELGAGTGFFTEHLLRRFHDKSWTINDIVPETETYLEKVVAKSGYNNPITFVWGDAESIAFPANMSLLASASLFQWFDALDVFLKRVGTNIAKGGYVVFSSFGANNFFEIREASFGNKGILFPNYEKVMMWCREAGFEILHSDDYIHELVFPTVSDMIHYLRDTGVNGSSKGSWSRAEYNDFCTRYKESFSKDGGVTLSFNPIIFILRKI